MIQNTTIEERVSILENQVVEIEEDLTDLDDDVGFLFDEQVIQDERLLNLEETSLDIIGELDLIGDDLDSQCLIRFIPFLGMCPKLNN